MSKILTGDTTRNALEHGLVLSNIFVMVSDLAGFQM